MDHLLMFADWQLRTMAVLLAGGVTIRAATLAPRRT
jgi:hypothetical protein